MEPYGACLEHLTDADRAAYLSTLAPGSDIDHRGTLISAQLLEQLLDALRDPTTAKPHIGDANFHSAQFTNRVDFREARFDGDATFHSAQFTQADFSEAQFAGSAIFTMAQISSNGSFRSAQFAGSAIFSGTQFNGGAYFDGARFAGMAFFMDVQVSGNAYFNRTQFSSAASPADLAGMLFASGDVVFDGARISGDVCFRKAQFETVSVLGPLVCEGLLDLSEAWFASPVTIKAAAVRVACRRTRWNSTASLRLRYSSVDLSDAVVESPLSIAARTVPFTAGFHTVRDVPEDGLVGGDPGVRMESLDGADAAHVSLHNVSLAGCRFSGTVHLDQLHLEGECPLAPTPPGRRWTERRTLAEEHHWRAAQGQAGWTAAPDGAQVVGPATLTPVYRALRKSFEDSKNEPDAADFYYGEMEMRRYDRTRPLAERALLAAYWALSGYGLRASRALGWLLGAMAATVLVMMLWGLPKETPRTATAGRLVGQDIMLTTDKPDPANPSGPLRARVNSKRWEKSLRVVVNSVVFRSSGQDLTTTGTYAEMASRVTEPVLLGLAALAIRSRVKR
ncbi:MULTISPECIES: pentapeptide repeat-containing protein [unclassified Streptomyces]|uniref:pentapeptide repeat-containing protein n=1 Tax=unclassified Streptomyces TaxID=2593676 RepID=UPI0033317E6E